MKESLLRKTVRITVVLGGALLAWSVFTLVIWLAASFAAANDSSSQTDLLGFIGLFMCMAWFVLVIAVPLSIIAAWIRYFVGRR